MPFYLNTPARDIHFLNLDEVINDLKFLPPSELVANGILTLAKDNKTYVCPFCGNGTGKSGDGLVAKQYSWGWNYECFGGCGQKGYDNISLVANFYGLDCKRDFVEICKRAAIDFLGYSPSDFEDGFTPTQTTANEIAAQAKLERDKVAAEKDAAEAELKEKVNALIRQTIDNVKGTADKLTAPEMRGIPPVIYNKFNCGVDEHWIHPKNILAGKNVPPSRRLIIPTADGLHYNAVLSKLDRTEQNKPFWKMHAGEKAKCTFGTQTLVPDNIAVFVTEGEIDALSMFYAWDNFTWRFDGNFSAGFIAMLGANGSAWYDELDNVFADSFQKPIVILVADNDETGNTFPINQHKPELLKRGYPTVINFFASLDEPKTDANDVLITKGANKLAEILLRFYYDANDKIDSLRNEVALAQSKLLEEQLAAEKIALEKQKAAKDKELLKQIFNLPFTDAFNATRLFLLFGDILRFARDKEIWGFYEGGVWKFESNSNAALFPYARRTLAFIEERRPRFHYSNSVRQDTLNTQSNDSVIAGETLSKQWQQARTWRNAIDALKGTDEILIRQDDLDNYPLLLNVKNGVIDLETGQLLQADPKLLLTRQCNADFYPTARCPVFDNFIEGIIPDEQTRAAVLRFLGYCITGLVNEHKALFVLGEGGNGKGTLFETIHYLLNDYATTFNVELILRQRFTRDPNAATPEIAKLVGVRFAYAPEIPAGREFDLAVFKALTGGDKITTRSLYGDSFTLNPNFKLLLSGQHLPKVENPNDVGFLRRFVPVLFTQTFVGKDADIHLPEKLRAAEELSGILARLVQEAIKWQREGLIVSAAMTAEKEKYKADNDFIRKFIEDNCEFVSGAHISRKAFLERLKKEYTQAYRFSDSKLSSMVRRVKGVEYRAIGRNKVNSFIGIRFIEDAFQDDLSFETPFN